MSGPDRIPQSVKELTRRFFELQSECDRLNTQLIAIRESRKQTEQQLVGQINNAGLNRFGITYQGQKINVSQDITYDTLTYKFLEECFMKIYSGDQEKVKKVIAFIKKQRRRTVSQVIKIAGHNSRSRPGTPSHSE